MKLKNIFALIPFLILAVSCSMEDDVLNEITKSEPKDNSNQTEVSLSFDINVNSVTTRANEIKDGGTGDVETVTSCSVILFENEKVIGAYDGSGITAETNESDEVIYKLKDARFLVKTGRNYEVYVIGDTKQAFKASQTKEEVEEYIAFDATDLSSNVKFGRAKVNIPASEGSQSASDTYTTKTISVELSNLTAQIRLMDVIGDIKEGESSGAVQLIKAELLNQNTTYTISDYLNKVVTAYEPAYTDPSWTGVFDIESNRTWNDEGGIVGEKDGVTTYSPIARFNSFPNLNPDAPVQIKLTFKVGSDETQTRTYTINRPAGTEEGRELIDENKKNDTDYVNPGYIYQLYAKVKLIGDQVECTLKCYTRDWLYNEVEVTMID